MPGSDTNSETGIHIGNERVDEKPLPKKRRIFSWCLKNSKLVATEYIATTLFIFLGCMSCVPLPGIVVSTMYSPFAFGLLNLIYIQAFGHISGAFMNPAVTLASVLFGALPISVGLVFVVTQCLGALTGYGLVVMVSPIDILTDGACVTSPAEGISFANAFIIEVCLTATLVFSNLGVWDPENKDRQDSAALKLGLTITGLSLAGGNFTGASMNPARSFGPAIISGKRSALWIYWAGPITGSALAVLLYKNLQNDLQSHKRTSNKLKVSYDES